MGSSTVLLWRSLLATACALGAGEVQAQTDQWINAAVQFNFVSPGARSLALGGAFVGLANDATAAFTNPAGLTTLPKPEVSLEGRGFKYFSVFTSAGPDGLILLRDQKAFNPPEEEEAANVASFSFASFMYPVGHFAFGAYRHELGNFKASMSPPATTLILVSAAGISKLPPLFEATGSMHLKIVNYGFSTAYRFGHVLSVGAGISAYRFEMSSTEQTVDPVSTLTQDGKETRLGYNLGVSWQINDKIRIGGAYRRAPDFDFEASRGPDCQLGDFPCTKTAHFNVPDAYAVGGALRPTESFTIALDYQAVRYSRLTDDYTLTFPYTDLKPTNFKGDDSHQLHVGFEYAVRRRENSFLIRVGGWNDPSHKIHFQGPAPLNSDTAGAQAYFPGGKDAIHFCGGLGFVVGRHLQLDTGFDVPARARSVFNPSDGFVTSGDAEQTQVYSRQKVFSLSAVIRF